MCWIYMAFTYVECRDMVVEKDFSQPEKWLSKKDFQDEIFRRQIHFGAQIVLMPSAQCVFTEISFPHILITFKTVNHK
jgi:hypothetical protein